MIIKDRIKFILGICKEKSVLDVGCVGHNAINEKNSYWLHKNLKRVARRLVGLDIAKQEIKILNKKGYNIKYGDVENFDLNEKFDVIVCGEIIEHLSNVGLFLDCLKKHLKKNGVIIITTPNVFRFRNLLRLIFLGKVVPNKEHTCWFDKSTLEQLFARNNLDIIFSCYYHSNITSKTKFFIETLICRINERYAPQLLFVVTK